MKALLLVLPALLLSNSLVMAADVSFSAGPAASKVGGPSTGSGQGKVKIAFVLSAPADVAVAVLGADGKVVRHLAAGVLGAKTPPPSPLQVGLSQSILWDGKDDFGKPANGGAFKVRVRAGTGVKFGRFIGGNPLAPLGNSIWRFTVAPDGGLYVYSSASGPMYFPQILKLDSQGRYQRTVSPFSAGLAPERVKQWARFDGKALRPFNRDSLGPILGATGRVLPQLRNGALLLEAGSKLYQIGSDGGQAPGGYELATIWPPRAGMRSSVKMPQPYALSPDGKYLYLSGPCSLKTKHRAADPRFPPGQVYRMEIGKGTMKPWVRLPGGARAGAPAVDKHGNVMVPDMQANCIRSYSPAGKEIGKTDVKAPLCVAVHPSEKHIYVLTSERVVYRKHWTRNKQSLVKLSGPKQGKQLARLDLGLNRTRLDMIQIGVSASKTGTTLWTTGLRGGLVSFEDKGDKFEIGVNISAKTIGTALREADRIAVDPVNEIVYINDCWKAYRRFDGNTGKGGQVIALDGKGVTDMTVGPDGYIYAQLGWGSALAAGYSGPLKRFTLDLKPAPYKATGTHQLSGYIYGRMHPAGGLCEKGLGASRDGKVYCYWMFGGWVRYALSAWGASGKSLNGKHVPIDPNHAGRGTSADLRRAVVGPIMGAGGGVRIDSRGRIYLGLGVHPEGFKPPPGFEKDIAYQKAVGSIVRFGPDGGSWGKTRCKPVVAVKLQVKKSDQVKTTPGAPKFFMQPAPMPKGALKMNGDNYFVGADKAYGGLGPMSGSHADTGGMGNIRWCVCRTPRFDLDMYDRLYVPNAITNSVRMLDNAGNLILEFGAYGNFDSQYVPEGAEAGKPIVATPEIPLGWPVGAAASRKAIYVSDMLNRRVVRADLTYRLEATCAVK
jgi:hypothetical protein